MWSTRNLNRSVVEYFSCNRSISSDVIDSSVSTWFLSLSTGIELSKNQYCISTSYSCTRAIKIWPKKKNGGKTKNPTIIQRFWNVFIIRTDFKNEQLSTRWLWTSRKKPGKKSTIQNWNLSKFQRAFKLYLREKMSVCPWAARALRRSQIEIQDKTLSEILAGWLLRLRTPM